MRNLFIWLNNLYHSLLDFIFDLRRGFHTRGNISLERLNVVSNNRDHGRKYQPSRTQIVRRALKTLPAHILSRPFIDLGCGKGRVLTLAAERGHTHVVGLDFSPELIKACAQNLAKVKLGPFCEYSLILGDAIEFIFPQDVGVVYLFNPFDSYVLSRIIENVEQSRIEQEVYFVYVNPLRDYLFRQRKNFSLVSELDHFNHNNKVSIFKYSPPSFSAPLL